MKSSFDSTYIHKTKTAQKYFHTLNDTLRLIVKHVYTFMALPVAILCFQICVC